MTDERQSGLGRPEPAARRRRARGRYRASGPPPPPPPPRPGTRRARIARAELDARWRVGIIFTLVALFGISLTAAEVRTAVALSSGSVDTVGVVHHVSFPYRGSWVTDAQVAFTTQDGEEVQVRVVADSSREVGDRVAVRYDPRDPTTARLTGDARARWSMTAGALLMLLVGVLAVVSCVRGGPRGAWSGLVPRRR